MVLFICWGGGGEPESLNIKTSTWLQSLNQETQKREKIYKE